MADDLEQIAAEDVEGQPGLPELLDQVLTAAAERMHAIVPGVASAVSATAGTCSAQQAVTRSGADDEAVVPDVPMLQLRTPTAYITLPPGAGPVLLLHADRSLDEWSQGDGTAVIQARDSRSHDPGDALALPLGPGAVDASNVVIACDALVLLGGDSATAIQAVIRGDAFNTALNTFLAACVTFGNANPLTGGVAFAAAATVFQGLLSGLLSTKVKVA